MYARAPAISGLTGSAFSVRATTAVEYLPRLGGITGLLGGFRRTDNGVEAARLLRERGLECGEGFLRHVKVQRHRTVNSSRPATIITVKGEGPSAHSQRPFAFSIYARPRTHKEIAGLRTEWPS